MSWLSSLFSKDKALGTQPSVETKIQPDPYKTAVSSPLSAFLASQIGKGIGEGPEVDNQYVNRYNEFLSMNPTQYFSENIAKPAYEQFTKYAKPIIDEGYAGALRGSGHYGALESGFVGLGESLANTAATFVPSFAQSQIQVGQSEFARRYDTWFKSLPVTNPALAAGIQFLNSDSGYNVLNVLNPGQKGWFQDLLNAGIRAATTVAMSGGF